MEYRIIEKGKVDTFINVSYCDSIETLRKCLIDAINKTAQKSVQIGDLKNKLIKAQEQIIALRQQLNNKYKCNRCGDVFRLNEVASLSE